MILPFPRFDQKLVIFSVQALLVAGLTQAYFAGLRILRSWFIEVDSLFFLQSRKEHDSRDCNLA